MPEAAAPIRGARCGYADYTYWPLRLLALAVIRNALDDIALRRGVNAGFNVHPWAYRALKYERELICVEEVIEWLNSENCEFWCDIAGLDPGEVSREALNRMLMRDDGVWVM
jgi:hypothetical protein